MVDIHCHILPEIDDGAKSWGVATEMCRLALEDGIEHIVATAHVNDRYTQEPQHLEATLERLKELTGNALRLSLACEVHFNYDNLQEVLAQPDRYAITGTPYVLVEFSDFGIPPSTTANLLQLIAIGVRPIITHPERNAMLARSPERILEWVEHGCAMQITASSLTGFWGPRPRKMCEWLLRNSAVHVIASDAHDERRRPPVLSEGYAAAAALCGHDLARALVKDNPEAIVAGRDLPYFD